jgi:DNA-binding PadR family transcriptional regulator
MVRRSQMVGWADPSLLILGSLIEGPKHGYSITADIADHAGTDLGPGTLYGALARLEEQGLVEALPEDGPRRPYKITAAGIAILQSRLAAMRTFERVAFSRLKIALS